MSLGHVLSGCVPSKARETGKRSSFHQDTNNELLFTFTEQEILEALAQYDFKGRTDRELSFKKGDVLVVFQRKSDDWWEGALNGKEGFIPDKYIVIKKYYPR